MSVIALVIVTFMIYYLYKYFQKNVIIKSNKDKNPSIEGKVLCCPKILYNSFKTTNIWGECGKICKSKDKSTKICKSCERCVTFEIKVNFKGCLPLGMTDYSRVVALGAFICGDHSKTNPIKTFPIHPNNFGYGLAVGRCCLEVMKKHKITFKLVNCYDYISSSLRRIESSPDVLHETNHSYGSITKEHLVIDLTDRKYDCGCCCPMVEFKLIKWDHCGGTSVDGQVLESNPSLDSILWVPHNLNKSSGCRRSAVFSIHLKRRIGCQWLFTHLYINNAQVDTSAGTSTVSDEYEMIGSALLGPEGSPSPSKEIVKVITTKPLISGTTYNLKLEVYSLDDQKNSNAGWIGLKTKKLNQPTRIKFYQITPPNCCSK